jgi:hypothetical protein
MEESFQFFRLRVSGGKEMQVPEIHGCCCLYCQQEVDHPDKEFHWQINLMMSQLTHAQRRLYAAIESKRMGKGGCRLVSEITGLCPATLQRGRAELAALLRGTPLEGAQGRPGRPSIEEKYPGIKSILEQLVAGETAGDPMTRKKWVRTSGRKLSKKLAQMGYRVNYHTVCRLLKDMGYSMKVNVKKRASTTHSPKRDAQFSYIAAQRAAFLAAGTPIISVDAKKKELIGNFRADGKSWCKEPINVSEYTYPSMAEYVATPYGVYDVWTNKGYVWVGTSGNTPAFAVTAIKRWWLYAGRYVYPEATNLLVLADGGGSNGCRCRAWKSELQTEICDGLGLTVTVCHYPPRCSKYNPIERRLFSHISMNWAGKPLTSLDLMLGYIRGTTTETGLTVEAFLLDGTFLQGQHVSKKAMDRLVLQQHQTCPDWNYTIKPRLGEDAE